MSTAHAIRASLFANATATTFGWRRASSASSQRPSACRDRFRWRRTDSLRAVAYPLVQEARRWPPPSLRLVWPVRLSVLVATVNFPGSSQRSVQFWSVSMANKSSIVSDLHGCRTPSVSGEELQAHGKSGPQ